MASSGPAPVLTPEQVISGKVALFARQRRSIASSLALSKRLPFPPEVDQYFAAVETGDWNQAVALFESMKRRRRQDPPSPELDAVFPAVFETHGAAEQVRLKPAQELLDYGHSILDPLPPGAIYVAGSDESRYIPTLLNATSDGESRIIMTDRALADRSYQQYLEFLHGDSLQLLSEEESNHAFADYIADATRRLEHDEQKPDEPRQLRDGEDVRRTEGRLTVSGQVAVMAINERLLQQLQEKNPDRPFAREKPVAPAR